MCRNYHLYRLRDLTKLREIERRAKALDGLETMEISEDLRVMRISAQEECFSQVMDRIVNICKRIAPECDVVYRF